MEAEGLLRRVVELGRELQAALANAFGAHLHVGDIRGRGLFWSLELVRDRARKTPFPPEARLAARIKTVAQDLGLICYPSSGTADGVAGDHVLLAPPYIIGSAQIEEIVVKLSATLSAVLPDVADAA